MSRKAPEIVAVDRSQLDDFLRRAEQQLDAKDFQLLRTLIEAYAFLTKLVEDKKTTLRRLRNLLFGARTEKTATVTGRSAEAPGGDAQAAATATAAPAEQAGAEASQPSESAGAARKKGHGRHGADDYPGGQHVEVPHASLHPGDPCPDCGKGTLYQSRSGVIVRFCGQAPIQATIFELQKLRCHLCGKIFTAEPPPQAQGAKYDATAASLIALLKYGTGLPFNRLQGLQRNLGIPLPASTQWEVVLAHAAGPASAYQELIRQAAQGDVLHHDDTTVKILALLQQSARCATDEAEAARSGLFTSGVVALGGGHRIALFFSGRQHAGENLADVLKHRAAELAKPIQMCDALSRNMPPELQTIVANCLTHARRNFVDVYDLFPDECGHVLEALATIYRNDAQAREEGLSADARLAFHQQASRPTMTGLKDWIDRQFRDKLVEPNSKLGEALRYLLNHWEKLTLFLRVAGAPLDNNICERALKKAILHRKNSYFYKTENGARVGDLYMSLIHTCELCGVNAFDYLTALHRQPVEVAAAAHLWLPWNYRAALEALTPSPPAA